MELTKVESIVKELDKEKEKLLAVIALLNKDFPDIDIKDIQLTVDRLDEGITALEALLYNGFNVLEIPLDTPSGFLVDPMFTRYIGRFEETVKIIKNEQPWWKD